MRRCYTYGKEATRFCRSAQIPERLRVHEMQRKNARATRQGQEEKNKVQKVSVKAATIESKRTTRCKSLISDF